MSGERFEWVGKLADIAASELIRDLEDVVR